MDYYCPEKGDLRIGYRCEYNVSHMDYWVSVTLDEKNIKVFSISDLRIPFLTDQDLLDLGFIKKEQNTFAKQSLRLHYSEGKLKLEDTEKGVLFNGKCRCINELEYILKLVN